MFLSLYIVFIFITSYLKGGGVFWEMVLLSAHLKKLSGNPYAVLFWYGLPLLNSYCMFTLDLKKNDQNILL